MYRACFLERLDSIVNEHDRKGLKMKLTLKNIGKIREATVELNGITVIAGGNDTGKSTVGKALYCLFNSLYQIDDTIRREQEHSIKEALKNNKNLFFGLKEKALPQMILSQKEQYLKDEDKLMDIIREYAYIADEDDARSISKRVKNILSISDDVIIKTVMTKVLSLEFDGQVNNIFHKDDGEIELVIKEHPIKVVVEDNKVVEFKEKVQLDTETIYIDDPFILDTQMHLNLRLLYPLDNIGYSEHREHLKSKIYTQKEKIGIVDSILIEQGLSEVLSKLNAVCKGEIEKDSMEQLVYIKKGKTLNIRNISTGLKTFAILKILLENGTIERNGTIILDEPEIHLHPEWQLVFAEIIVLLQKEFQLHILLNTHSPYFLKAIETYSAKYEIADRCKYYLADVVGEDSILEDVTTYTEKIYQKLTAPLETLQREIYSND